MDILISDLPPMALQKAKVTFLPTCPLNKSYNFSAKRNAIIPGLDCLIFRNYPVVLSTDNQSPALNYLFLPFAE
jgi:hypothetical protein